MLVRRFSFACLALGAACLLGQDGIDRAGSDRERYSRDYVRFLVLQLDQWSQEFPHQFYLAMMKPPVDASKLSEGAKAAAGERNKEIADHLQLSMDTVRTYIRRTYEKLHVHSRTEAVVKYLGR